MANITAPSITLRTTKGSPLTNAEVDANFTNISNALQTGLTAASYTAADVLAKLLTVDGAGSGLDADTVDGYNQDTANTYFGDTVIVSSTRLANTAGFANTSTAHVGWQHVTTGTGGRAGRVQVETLVALSNVAIANTNSGRTSNTNTYYTGV
mgnify:CR=1 FL=1